jgi:hypothetical protein
LTNITFFGGAGEVGRNCVLVEDGRANLLLDAGVKLGETDEYPLISDEEVRKLQRIAISHTHLDHMGYLPYMYANGCRAHIYSTKPTHDLSQLLLADYQRINRGMKFSNSDIIKAMKMWKMVEYGEVVGDVLKFSFHKSGHILGSSMVLVQGDSSRLLFSSDVNDRETKLLDPAEKNLVAENLIIESTYGAPGDEHPTLKSASKMLCDSINRTIKKGGKVIIPSFAVGRAQDILFVLESYMSSGVLENVPIFVDGMILKANRIYRQNVIYARDEIQKRILMSDDDPFKSKFFHTPHTKDRSDVIESGSAIIVSTSGMLSGGPVLHYMEKLAGDSRNLLIFVGYQAEGTLGRKLVDGQRHITIDGKEVEIKMGVEQLSFSAHADYKGLLDIVRSTKKLKRVFVIHGEGDKPSKLGEAIGKMGYEVVIPRNGESFRI